MGNRPSQKGHRKKKYTEKTMSESELKSLDALDDLTVLIADALFARASLHIQSRVEALRSYLSPFTESAERRKEKKTESKRERESKKEKE